MRSWLAALLLFASAANADIDALLDGCASTWTDADWLAEVVAEACPDAVDAIERHPLVNTLRDDWRQTLTTAEARQLAFHGAYYDRDRASDRRIDLDALDAVVERLDNPTRVSSEKSLWQRFNDWLRDVFGADEREAPSWFDDWLSGIRVPQTVLEYSFYAISGLIIIAAVAVIAIELRAARSAGRRGHGTPLSRPENGAGSAHRRPTLADLEAAAVEDKPAILLALLRDKLESLALLPYRPATTHREFAFEVSALPREQSETLVDVSRSAERIRYGGSMPAEEEVNAVLAPGVSLLDRLGRQ